MMNITQESIAAYKELMTNPNGHGLTFPSLAQIFEETEQATAKHILFQQYINIIKKPLPKVFFYIIMDKLYQQAKAEDGNIGYCVRGRMAEENEEPEDKSISIDQYMRLNPNIETGGDK